MTQSITNNATTLLAADMTAVQTTATVTSAAKFPASGAAPYTILIDSEYMLVTGGMGTSTWTVTRGVEGSTPTTHNGTSSPATVQLELTAGVFAALADGGPNSAWNFIRPSGLVGATSLVRWVGGTASGPPTSGTFGQGDFITTLDGNVWVCTTAGSPGTWKQPGQTSPYYGGAFLNTPQALSSVPIKILLDTASTDLPDANSNWDVVTNHRFTAAVRGRYGIAWRVGTDGNYDMVASLFVNGTVRRRGSEAVAGPGNGGGSVGSCYTILNATDYCELYVDALSSGDNATTGQRQTYMDINYLGPA